MSSTSVLSAPGNPENKATDEEANAIRHFLATNAEEMVNVDFEDNDVHYFRPIRLTGMCLRCHGDSSTAASLWGTTDGKDITGHAMEGLKEGTVYGAFKIVQSLDSAKEKQGTALKQAGIGGILALFLCRFVSLVSCVQSVRTSVHAL